MQLLDLGGKTCCGIVGDPQQKDAMCETGRQGVEEKAEQSIAVKDLGGR